MKTTVSYYASEKLQKEMIEAGKKGEREQTTILEIQPTSIVYKEIKISPTGEATLNLIKAPYKSKKKSTVEKYIYRMAAIKEANTEVKVRIEDKEIRVGFNAVKEYVEYEYEEAEKYVDDKTRYGKKLMLDKEPTLLDIEKIFSTAMIEEGKDWKTKMGEAETILEKKIEKKTMEGWVEKEKRDSIAKEEAGLYIDKTKIINSFYFFDCIYGISSDNYKSGLIYYENIPSDAKPIKFFMNDVEISTDYALNSEYNNLKIGDLILCNFKPYQTTAGTIPDGMDVKLMQRLSCIGIVSDIPSSISGNKYYIVKFHSVKPQLGWGLKYLENHEFGYSTSTPDLRDSEVTHKLIKARIGKTGTDDKAISNLSGLQVYASPNDINPNTNQSTTIPSELLYTTLPTGISSTSKNFKRGIS